MHRETLPMTTNVIAMAPRKDDPNKIFDMKRNSNPAGKRDPPSPQTTPPAIKYLR